jgi:hypothetical protein
VLFEWNQSFTYVLTAAYFATRLEGAPVFEAGNPSPGLDGNSMRELQRRLPARAMTSAPSTASSVRAPARRSGKNSGDWACPPMPGRPSSC